MDSHTPDRNSRSQNIHRTDTSNCLPSYGLPSNGPSYGRHSNYVRALQSGRCRALRIDRRVGGARRRRCCIRTSTTARGRTAPIRSTSAPSRRSTSTTTRTRIVSEGPWRRTPRPARARLPRAARASTIEQVEPDGAGARHRSRAPADSGTSGRRSTRRSAPTAIRSGSGTSAPA